MRRDLVAKLLDSNDGRIGFFARHEVLRLEFRSTARRKVHAKVGEPFVPRSRYTHLFSAVFCRVTGKRMQIAGCWGCSVKIGAWIDVRALDDTAFDPDLGGTMILPVGKETYAVAAPENIIEVVF